MTLMTLSLTETRRVASRPPRVGASGPGGGLGARPVGGAFRGLCLDCGNSLARLKDHPRGTLTPRARGALSRGRGFRAPARGGPGERGVDGRPVSAALPSLPSLAAARGRAKALAAPASGGGGKLQGPHRQREPWRPVTLERLGDLPVGPTYAPWMASLWRGPWLRRPPVAVAEAVVPRRIVLPPRPGSTPRLGPAARPQAAGPLQPQGHEPQGHEAGWKAAARARDAFFAGIKTSRLEARLQEQAWKAQARNAPASGLKGPASGPKGPEAAGPRAPWAWGPGARPAPRGGPGSPRAPRAPHGARVREARVRVAADGRLDTLLTRGFGGGGPRGPRGHLRGPGPKPFAETAVSVSYGGPGGVRWWGATVLPATAVGYGAYWRWALAWCNAHSPRELMAVVRAAHRVRWEAPTAFQAPVGGTPRAPLDEGDMPWTGPTGAWHPAAPLIPGEMARRARKTFWKRRRPAKDGRPGAGAGAGGPLGPLGSGLGAGASQAPGPRALVGWLGSVVPAGRGGPYRRALETALGATLVGRGARAALAAEGRVRGGTGVLPRPRDVSLVRAGVAGFVHPRTGWGVSRTPWQPVPAGDTKAPAGRAPRTYVPGSGRHTWVRGRVPVTNPGPRAPYRLDADRVDLLGGPWPQASREGLRGPPLWWRAGEGVRGLPLWWRVRRAVPKPVLPGWLRWHEAARRAAVPGRAAVGHVQAALEGVRADAARILAATAGLRLQRLAPEEAAAQRGVEGPRRVPWRAPYPYQVRPDDPRPRREHPDWRRSRDVPTVRARGMRPPVAWSPGFYGPHAPGWLEAAGGAPEVPTPHGVSGGGLWTPDTRGPGRLHGSEAGGATPPQPTRPTRPSRPQALEARGVGPGEGPLRGGLARTGKGRGRPGRVSPDAAPGAWRMTPAGWAVPAGPWALPERVALHAAFGPVGTAARVHGMGGVLLRRAARFGEDPLARQRWRTWSAAYRARREAKAARWLPLKPGFAFPARYTGFLAASTASFLPTDPQALVGRDRADPGNLQGPRGGPDGPLHPAWVRLRAYRPVTAVAGPLGGFGGPPRGPSSPEAPQGVMPWTPWAPEAVGPGPKGYARVRRGRGVGPVAPPAPDLLDRAGGPMAWTPPAHPATPAHPALSEGTPRRWSFRGPLGPKGWATWVRPDAQAAGMAQVAAAMFPPEAGPKGPEADPQGPEAGPKGPEAGPKGPEAGPTEPDAGPAEPEAGPQRSEDAWTTPPYPTPEGLVPAAVAVGASWLWAQGVPATLGPEAVQGRLGPRGRGQGPLAPVAPMAPGDPRRWQMPEPAVVEAARRGPKPATAWERLLAREVTRVWMARFGVTDPWQRAMYTGLRQAWEAWAARQVRRRRRGRYPRVPRPRRVARLHALGFGTWQRPRWFRAGRVKKPRRTGYAYAYGPSDPRGGVRALAPVGLSPYAPRRAPTALVTEATPLTVRADDGTPVTGGGAPRPVRPERPGRPVRAYTRAGRLWRPFGVGRDGSEAAWWGVPAPAVGLDPSRVAAFTVPDAGGWYATPDGRRAPGRPLPAGWLPGQSPYTPRTRTNAPGFMAVWDPGPSAGLLAPLWEALGRWRMARVLLGPRRGPRRGPLRGPRGGALRGPRRGFRKGRWRGVGAEVLAQPAAFLEARPVGQETPLTGVVGAYGPHRRPARALQRRAARAGWAWGAGGRWSPYAALALAATVPRGPRRGRVGSPRTRVGGPVGSLRRGASLVSRRELPRGPRRGPLRGPLQGPLRGPRGTVLGLKAAGYTRRRRGLGVPSRWDRWPLAPERGAAVALLATLGRGTGKGRGIRPGHPRARPGPGWARRGRIRLAGWVPEGVAAIEGYARAREGTWTYGTVGDPYPEGRWVHVRYPGDGALMPLRSRAAEALGSPRGGPGEDPFAIQTDPMDEEAHEAGHLGPEAGPQGSEAGPPRARGPRGGHPVAGEEALTPEAREAKVQREAARKAIKAAAVVTAVTRLRGGGARAPFRNRPFVPGAGPKGPEAVPLSPAKGPSTGASAPVRRVRGVGWEPAREVRAYLHGVGRRAWQAAPRKASKYTARSRPGVIQELAWAVFAPTAPGRRRRYAGWRGYQGAGARRRARRRALDRRVEGPGGVTGLDRAWRTHWLPGYAWAPWPAFLLRLRRHWLAWATVGPLGRVAEATRRALWERQGRAWAFKAGAQARRWVRLWEVGGDVAYLHAVARHRREWEVLGASVAAARVRWWRRRRGAWVRGLLGAVQLHRILAIKLAWRQWAHTARLRAHAIRLRDRARTLRRATARRVGLAPDRERAGAAAALVAVSPVLPGGMAAQAPMWAAWQRLLGDRIDDVVTGRRALAPLVRPPLRARVRGRPGGAVLPGPTAAPLGGTAAERGARGPTPLVAWGWDDGALPLRARVYPFDPLGPGNAALLALWAHDPRVMQAVRAAESAWPGPEVGGVTPWAFVGPDGRTWVPLAGIPVRAVAVYRPAVTAVARVPGAWVRTLAHDPGARAAVVPSRRAGENPYVAAAADLTPRWLRMPRHVRDDPALARAMAVVGTGDRNLTAILSAWYRRRALLATPGDLYHLARRPLTLDEA